jgi:hypothetical protein
MEAFETQRAKQWFEKETFLSLMGLRGMERVAAMLRASFAKQTCGMNCISARVS